MLTLFGIKQCDTCRKALRWFAEQGQVAVLHDLRTDGLDAKLLQQWTTQVAVEQLLNKRSTTWRQLSEADRQQDLYTLLLANPTLIKRPVIVQEKRVLAIGFKPDQLQEYF